jgi:hypothetical protein
VEVAVEVRVEARVPERRRAKRVRNAKARQDEEEREVPGEILWKESDSPRESEQEVDGDSHEVPSCAAQWALFPKDKPLPSVAPLDQTPVHRHVPHELIAGGSDERDDPERALLSARSEETPREDDDGGGVLQSVEVVWPPLASLHRASQALHESYPERGEGEEGDENVSVEGTVLPSGGVNGFSRGDMVGEPPIESQEEVDEREGQVAEDSDKRGQEISCRERERARETEMVRQRQRLRDGWLTDVAITELNGLEGCHEDLGEHEEVDPPLVEWEEEAVEEIDEEQHRDGMRYSSITREGDDASESLVEEQEREEVDEREVHGEVEDVDLHLLGLTSEEGGDVGILKREELDVVDTSWPPDEDRDSPHEEQEDEVSETDEDREGRVLEVSEGGRGRGRGWSTHHPDVLSEPLVVGALRDRPEEQDKADTDFERQQVEARRVSWLRLPKFVESQRQQGEERSWRTCRESLHSARSRCPLRYVTETWAWIDRRNSFVWSGSEWGSTQGECHYLRGVHETMREKRSSVMTDDQLSSLHRICDIGLLCQLCETI